VSDLSHQTFSCPSRRVSPDMGSDFATGTVSSDVQLPSVRPVGLPPDMGSHARYSASTKLATSGERESSTLAAHPLDIQKEPRREDCQVEATREHSYPTASKEQERDRRNALKAQGVEITRNKTSL